MSYRGKRIGTYCVVCWLPGRRERRFLCHFNSEKLRKLHFDKLRTTGQRKKTCNNSKVGDRRVFFEAAVSRVTTQFCPHYWHQKLQDVAGEPLCPRHQGQDPRPQVPGSRLHAQQEIRNTEEKQGNFGILKERRERILPSFFTKVFSAEESNQF